ISIHLVHLLSPANSSRLIAVIPLIGNAPSIVIIKVKIEPIPAEKIPAYPGIFESPFLKNIALTFFSIHP
ncbi:hypothetical protein ACOL21_11435, partial [Aliarcobacter butzleri]